MFDQRALMANSVIDLQRDADIGNHGIMFYFILLE